MALKFDCERAEIIDVRCPLDKIFNGGRLEVCYTLKSDNITRGEKPASTPYVDRNAGFAFDGGKLVSSDASAELSVIKHNDGLVFELESDSDELSEFGINLPFNFMSKLNGGGWRKQFLFNSPYVSPDNSIIYTYLTKPDGNNLVVAVLSESDGWKMDYSPYLCGHFFLNLKLFSNFDRAYKTPRRARKLKFAVLPVGDFSDCLSKLAELYGVPFADYDVSGGKLGTEITLKIFGKCDGYSETADGLSKEIDGSGKYTIRREGETTLTPMYKGKKGAPVTVYGYSDIIGLYGKTVYAVSEDDLAATDGNLCEHQCWAPATLRFLSKYRDTVTPECAKELESRVKKLLDVVTETDAEKAVFRRTVLSYPYKGFPAYNVFLSNRIQEEFFGITLLLDAYKYFGDEKYYEYAVNTTDSLLDNYQKPDGRLERVNDGVPEDYTTVCCPMIPIVDMANFTAKTDPERSKKYFGAAKRMAEFLYNRGLVFPTEGGVSDKTDGEMEDGSISCTALALLYYCKNVERVDKYIEKAKEILDLHDNWVIKTPVCQMHGSSLRWWETQWEGDADGPAICAGHAWSIWRAEADWLYAALTGDGRHRLKAKNGFMTNLSKIRADGKSYAIYNPDLINGGGFVERADDVKFEVARRFSKQTDSGLSRYVWIRLFDTFLSEKV